MVHHIGTPPPELDDGDDLEVEEYLEQQEEASPLAVVGPTSVDLPGGYGLSDGTVVRTATVRELTGYDEEELARSDVKRPLDFIAKLVNLAVTSIGGHTMTPLMLTELLLGDRDTLILGIRRATYGDELTYENLKCPNCDRDFDIVVHLDEIPIKALNDPVTDRQFTITLLHGQKAVLDLPRHGDQLAMIESTSKVPEQNSILLSRCIVTIDGQEITSMFDTPQEVVKKLNMRDRQLLIEELRKRQPGPRFEEVKIECPACSYEDRLTINPIDMFRI